MHTPRTKSQKHTNAQKHTEKENRIRRAALSKLGWIHTESLTFRSDIPAHYVKNLLSHDVVFVRLHTINGKEQLVDTSHQSSWISLYNEQSNKGQLR